MEWNVGHAGGVRSSSPFPLASCVPKHRKPYIAQDPATQATRLLLPEILQQAKNPNPISEQTAHKPNPFGQHSFLFYLRVFVDIFGAVSDESNGLHAGVRK